MPRHEQRVRIHRPASEVFDFVGTHGYRNNPRWEKECQSWSDVDPLPIGVGTIAVMHRVDDGKPRDVHMRCVEFTPGRRVAWQHTDPGPFQFAIAFEVIPLAARESELIVNTNITLGGPLRLMAPLFKRRMVATGDRLVGECARLLESGATTDNGTTTGNLATA